MSAINKGFGNGYVKLPEGKLPIVWTGQNAQHVAENNAHQKRTHPLLHLRIQQLAAVCREWKKGGKNRYTGTVINHPYEDKFLVVLEVDSTFASIITCYKLIK